MKVCELEKGGSKNDIRHIKTSNDTLLVLTPDERERDTPSYGVMGEGGENETGKGKER